MIMKSKTESFELTPVQMWLIKLRARMAVKKGLAAAPVRPGHPTVTGFMSTPRATL